MRIPHDDRQRRSFTSSCRGVPVHITEEVQHRPGVDGEPIDANGFGWLVHYEFRAVRSERSGRGRFGVPFPISETGYRSHFHRGEPYATEQITDRLDWIAADTDSTRAQHLRYLEGRIKRAGERTLAPHQAGEIRSRTISLDPTGCDLVGRILTLPDDAGGQAERQRIVRACLACLDAIATLPIPTEAATICGGKQVRAEAILAHRTKILSWRVPLTAALDQTGDGGTGDLFGGAGPDFGPLLAMKPHLGVAALDEVEAC